MSFSQTAKRVANLAAGLWALQSGWILLTAGIYGFSYLFPAQSASAILLVASLLQMVLYVYWLKAGAKAGGFTVEAFAGLEPDWMRYLGISLGVGLPFAILFMLSFVLLILGPLGWALTGFAWFAILALLELYSPVVSVRSQGFRQAFSMTLSLLRRFENRQALTEGAFWYPALLGLAASFLQMLVNPSGGLSAAIVGFALAAFQLPWYTAAQLVIYENVWNADASPEAAEAGAAE